MKRRNIILCGVGGQGTILASRLIAAAAMKRGIPVKTAETIGMAQRGGSVFSHVRLGEGIHSPMIPPGKADLIIGFEPAEAVRHLPFLKEGGTVVASIAPILPVSALIGASSYPLDEVLGVLKGSVGNLVLLDSEKATREIGSAKVLNVLLLGAAARTGTLGLAAEDLRAAMREMVPARFLEGNERALVYAEGIS